MSQQNLSTSSFKRFCLRIALPLLVGIFGAGFIFSWLFERQVILNSQINGAYKINRIINENNPEETPILGSSRALCAFIPDIIGENYFNYGLSNAQDDVILFFLKEEMKKKKTNPMIVINLDIDGLTRSIGDISYYLYNSNYQPVRQLLKDEYRPHFKIPFVKYYGYYEEYFKYMLNDRMNLTKYTNKGASSEKNVLTEKKFQELIKKRENTTIIFKNDPELLNEFNKIFAENPDRFFVFVVSPYHPSYFTNYRNYDEMKKFLADWDAKENVKVYDFSNTQMPDSMLVNTSHVNYLGAIKFSEILKDSLVHLKAEEKEFLAGYK